MSSEQFDKRIKGKLEQVKPSYQEQAWKNFQSLLPAPWYVTLFKTYSSWLYSGIGTVAIVATSYLYYQEKQENNQLHAKITTLQSQISNQEITRNQLPKDLAADTLPAVQPVPPSQSELREAPELPAAEKVKSKVASDKNKTNASVQKLNVGTKVPGEKTVAPVVRTNRIPDKPNLENKQSTTVPATTNKSNVPSSISAPVDSTPLPAINPTGITNQQTSKPDNTLPGIDKVAADSTANSPEDSANVANVAKTESEVKATNKSAGWQIRLGLLTDVNSFNKAAVGPTLEILFGQKLSLSTGLLFSTPEEKRLPFPRDYNMATGRRFEDDYRKHIPHNDRLQGIVVNTSTIRLPLGLNYYLPVKGNFSFMAIAGTKLNVSVYQTVEFRSYFGGEDQLNKFETRYKTNTFNNLYYGLGLQYKIGRFIGQVTPIYNMYFREPDYFNRSKKLGVNAALKFDLRK